MFRLVLSLVAFQCVASTPALKTLEDIRIVGGDDIDISEAPYQVSLMSRGRHTCGGTIIDRDLIVTAAHCVMGANPNDYQVRVGSSSNKEGGDVYQVGEFLWHPDFNYAKMDSDVALVWLPEPLEFGDNVAPIDLIDDGEEIKDGEGTTVTGWGYTKEGGSLSSTLQMVTVPKVSAKACGRAYAAYYSITPRMLCAGVQVGGKDACQGDSGGPLVYENKLAGVVSWGLGCARPSFPGVYAKISALRDWLDNSISFLKVKHLLRNI